MSECSPVIYHVRPEPLCACTGRVVSSMNSPTFPDGNPQVHGTVDGPEKEAVLRELESILSSPFFRTSNRSKQFLAYVVQHTLDGNHEPLKERTIGAKLFQRPVGYATGDDPVVRVQAGEVRRRLEQYHHAALNHSPVRIELPVGSYAPEFRWVPAAPDHAEPARAEPAPKEPAQEETAQATMPSVGETKQAAKGRKLVVWAAPILGMALLLVLLALILHRSSAQKSALNQFWSPVLTTTEPVLICLAKPSVYLPSAELLQRYSKSPEAFKTESQRLTQPAPLHPQDKLVRVLAGRIFDVVADIRPESPTYLKWISVELSAENFLQLYVPRGFAHGIGVLSEYAEIEYKCTDFYNPDDEIRIIWNDPSIGIKWPIENPIVSPKDLEARALADQPELLAGLREIVS